jgi:hypothetical protein
MKTNFFCLLACLMLSFHLHAQQWGYYTLIAPQTTSAYLVDTDGVVKKTYTFTGSTGYSAYMLPGGTIVRSVSSGGSGGGGSTGMVQKVDSSNTILWSYSNAYLHHDICPMPNGNILMIVTDPKTTTDATTAGVTSGIALNSEMILEIQPSGTSGGTIVWQWKLWDHICQSANSAKTTTYVSNTADHPEMLNINYSSTTADFFHMNGIDYNPYRDQIVVSSHYLNQIFVIDHSTTTAQAATHAGGNAGKGGDFLYRWGNPASYGATGTTNFSTVHDAHWVPQDVNTYANDLGGFNNLGGASSKSAADLVIPPYNGDYSFNWGTNGVYTPTTYSWRYQSTSSCSNMGNHEQLPNGNTLMCVAGVSVMEVTSTGTTLWSYTTNKSPQAHRYSQCYYLGKQPTKPTISASGNTLTCSTTGTSYQWFLNAYMIAGATSQTYTATATGTYQVQVRNASFCNSDISAKYAHTYISGTATTQSVTLTTGWNLVSFYVQPTTNTIASFFGTSISNVKEIKTQDAFWSTSNTAILNSLTTINAATGYLIYCTTGFTLTISGTNTTATFPTTFATGWNLVGVPSSTALTIASTVNSTTVNTIKNFVGFWVSGGTTNSITTLDPGKGYFVKGN